MFADDDYQMNLDIGAAAVAPSQIYFFEKR